MNTFRKIISSITILSLLLSAAALPAAVSADGISVMVNSQPLSAAQPPEIINNRTMVPLRAIFEALGATVNWDAAAQTVTAAGADGTTVSLIIGGATATVNGQSKDLDQPAVIVNNSTLIPVRFVSEALGAKVSWDADSQTVTVTSPGGAYTEEDVTVDAGAGYPLGGTLSVPADAGTPHPCVLLVSGSGPNDRDETINSDKPFADIAGYLASNGIAALRYDKRTHTYGAKMVSEFGSGLSVEEEYIQDAVAAANLIKADPRIDANRVFILGHSEGGMLAPRIDAEGGNFAGIIIMAGSPRGMLDIIYDQLTAQAQLYVGTDNYALAMSQLAQVKQSLDGIKAMTDDEAKATAMNGILGPALGGGVSAYYYKEMDDHPAAGYIAAAAKPFLIMQGLSDIQVSPGVDFKGYQDLFAGRPNAAFKTYGGLTHLFMPATENDVVGNQKAYSTPEHVDARVLADITEWVKAN